MNVKYILSTNIFNSWVGYNKRNFLRSDDESYKIYSGVDHCFQPPNVTNYQQHYNSYSSSNSLLQYSCVLCCFQLLSLQPIGSLSNIYAESLTTFQHENFGGSSCSVTSRVVQGTSLPCHTSCRSLVIVGSSSWSLRSSKTGEWVCFKTRTVSLSGFPSKPGICILPSVHHSGHFKSDFSLKAGRFDALKKGCSGVNESEIFVPECIRFGEFFEDQELKMTEINLGLSKSQSKIIEYLYIHTYPSKKHQVYIN
jgi:hypothetical protein